MNGDSLFLDSRSDLGTPEGALDTTLGHGKLGLLGTIAISAKGREEEARMAVGPPIMTEQMECGLGER